MLPSHLKSKFWSNVENTVRKDSKGYTLLNANIKKNSDTMVILHYFCISNSIKIDEFERKECSHIYILVTVLHCFTVLHPHQKSQKFTNISFLYKLLRIVLVIDTIDVHSNVCNLNTHIRTI